LGLQTRNLEVSGELQKRFNEKLEEISLWILDYSSELLEAPQRNLLNVVSLAIQNTKFFTLELERIIFHYLRQYLKDEGVSDAGIKEIFELSTQLVEDTIKTVENQEREKEKEREGTE